MGSNRKHKKNYVPPAAGSSTSSSSSGGNNTSHHRRNSSKVPMTTILQSTESSTSTVATHPEDHKYGFTQALQEFEETHSNAFRITWKEIVTLGLVLVLFAALSIVVGVAAGISISVHFFETNTQESVNQRILNDIGMEGSVYRKVTTYDQSIASTNNLLPQGGDRLGRVIHTSEGGQKSVLMVVEESSMDDVNNSDDERCEWSDELGRGFSTRPFPPRMEYEDWATFPPKLCSDGNTRGYDSWSNLRTAIQEYNSFSALRYERWQEYFQAMSRLQAQASMDGNGRTIGTSSTTFDDDSLYYEQEIVFTICPRTVLRTRTEPIFINTESLMLECNDCTIEGRGTHLMFGPEARNVVVRGVKFTHATTSSVVFYYNGADASFENCSWIDNSAESPSWGAIADVKATRAYVNFYRCSVSKPIGVMNAAASSLSIRQPTS